MTPVVRRNNNIVLLAGRCAIVRMTVLRVFVWRVKYTYLVVRLNCFQHARRQTKRRRRIIIVVRYYNKNGVSRYECRRILLHSRIPVVVRGQ